MSEFFSLPLIVINDSCRMFYLSQYSACHVHTYNSAMQTCVIEVNDYLLFIISLFRWDTVFLTETKQFSVNKLNTCLKLHN